MKLHINNIRSKTAHTSKLWIALKAAEQVSQPGKDEIFYIKKITKKLSTDLYTFKSPSVQYNFYVFQRKKKNPKSFIFLLHKRISKQYKHSLPNQVLFARESFQNVNKI